MVFISFPSKNIIKFKNFLLVNDEIKYIIKFNTVDNKIKDIKFDSNNKTYSTMSFDLSKDDK